MAQLALAESIEAGLFEPEDKQRLPIIGLTWQPKQGCQMQCCFWQTLWTARNEFIGWKI
jgi:hypothetical protein